MWLIILLLILALLLGGIGLLFETLRWILIIAVILLIISIVSGISRRGRY